jgi:hypothetical protein
MTRFLLAVTVWSYVITPIALFADDPENRASAPHASAKSAPVYVKILLPNDPAPRVVEKDSTVVEAWITKSIENRNKANFTAVTTWVPLVEGPHEATELWEGKLDGGNSACHVVADVLERKDGLIKINFRGWTPFGAEATVTLQDEPGSREVVPVNQAKTKHGVPHIAIFIGLQEKRN